MFTLDNKIMIIKDRKENEIHCFIELINEKFIIKMD